MSLISTAITLSRNDIILSLAQSKKLKQASRNIIKHHHYTQLADDLLQELFLHLLEMPEEKFQDIILKNYQYWYSLSWMSFQTKSSRSPFVWKHQKDNFFLRDFNQESINGIFKAMENNLLDEPGEYNIKEQILNSDIFEYGKQAVEYYLRKYDKNILMLFLEENSTIKQIAKESSIKEISIRKTLKSIPRKVKKIVSQMKDENGLTPYDKLNTNPNEE